MKSLKQKIEVMQAALDGKIIEHKRLYNDKDWLTTSTHPHPDFNWIELDYRIKPEPMEMWVVFNMKGDFVGSHFSYGNAENTLKNIGSGTMTKFCEVTE